MKTPQLPRMSTEKPYHNYRHRNNGTCSNHLHQEFNQKAPNIVWVSDFTYIRVAGEWYYLCIVMDLFSRKIISWNISGKPDVNLAMTAFKKAYTNRERPQGLMFHSDYAEEKTMPKNPISVRFFSACILFFGIVFRVNCQSSEKIAFLMSAFFHYFSSSSTFGADLFMASLIISSVANA